VTVDKRELYLHVEAETWAETVELHPEKGKQPRGLAQAINVAARNIDAVRPRDAPALYDSGTRPAPLVRAV